MSSAWRSLLTDAEEKRVAEYEKLRAKLERLRIERDRIYNRARLRKPARAKVAKAKGARK